MEKAANRTLTGVRKRQQIETTNKSIFVWLIISSVIVSFSLVALQFMVREFLFNQKIIDAKSATSKQLQQNITAGKQLTANVNALLADTNLGAVSKNVADTKTSNLSVVLDALPVSGDATGFANSLQTVILPKSGVAISELSTSSALLDGTDLTGGSSAEPLTLPFKASVSGDYASIEKMLKDIAKVIRPINLTELSMRAEDDGKIQVTISGVTYYLPARSVGITEEVFRP